MRCTDCYGTGKITCPVCKGSTKTQEILQKIAVIAEVKEK